METLDKAQQFERLYATPPVYEWELIKMAYVKSKHRKEQLKLTGKP